jgi:hypothetical protein
MRYSEIITEKTVRLDDGTGHMFIVTKNPTRPQFQQAIANPDADMKGLLTDRDFYYWPAWHAHHGQIAYRLGLEAPITVFVLHNGIMAHASAEKMIVNHPVLQYLYGGEVPFIPD